MKLFKKLVLSCLSVCMCVTLTTTRVINELSNSKSSNKPARIFTNVKEVRVGSSKVVRSVYGGTARYVI